MKFNKSKNQAKIKKIIMMIKMMKISKIYWKMNNSKN
jgi:hypothetical protein